MGFADYYDMYPEGGSTLATGNYISNSTYNGLELSNTRNITLSNNLIANNAIGLYTFNVSGFNNSFYNNDVVGNTTQVQVVSAPSNIVYHLAAPTGGNYWSDYDTPGEGCDDTNSDGFCDAPYSFTDGADNLPLTAEANAFSYFSPTLTYSLEPGYDGTDGVDPETGTTSTNFTYKVVYTSASDKAPAQIQTKTDIADNTMTLDTSATAALQDGDYTNGEQYIFQTSIASAGSHTYYFHAWDGITQVNLPSATTINDPWVSDLAITPPGDTTGGVATPYSQTLAATGGTTPYSWSLSANALPRPDLALAHQE